MPSPRALLGATILFVVVTLWLTYPLVTDLSGFVPSDPGDPYLNTWILWWNSQAIPLTSAWWNAPAFFPAPESLTLSEHLLGLSLFTTPIIWITGEPQLGYSVAFLLTFILSGVGAFLLGYVLTGRIDAAVVAGLAYAYAPYRMAQFPHIHVLSSFWMPFALAGLHLFIREQRWRWLTLFAVATMLQGLTTGHYLLFFPVLAGLWTLWFAILPGHWRAAALIAIALVAACAASAPVLLHYDAVHRAWNLHRTVDEIALYSADITGLLAAEPNLRWWGGVTRPPAPEAQLFPGLTVVVLVAVGVILACAARTTAVGSPAGRWRRARQAIVGAAMVMTLVALAHWLFGGWQLDLGIVHISAQRISRPVSVALALWVVALASWPRAHAAIRARSAFPFYVGATLIMWVLAFGPFPTWNGRLVIYWAPYRWLMMLPGFDGIRVPARFAMLASLCLAAAACVAAARLSARLPQRWRWALVGGLACGILADGWIRGMPLARPPEPLLVTKADAAGAVLELPLAGHEIASMYRTMTHRHPVVNGYSGYAPPTADVVHGALESHDADLLGGLAALGLRHIVVFGDDTARYDKWHALVQSLPGVRRVASAGEQTHYTIEGQGEPPRPPASDGPRARIASITSPLFPGNLSRLLDDDLGTAWNSGTPQSGAEEEALFVNLAGVQKVAGVRIMLGQFRASYPRGLRIQRSVDCETWDSVWEGPTAAMVLVAVLARPREVPLDLRFDPVDAKCLSIHQTGVGSKAAWIIAELRVLGP